MVYTEVVTMDIQNSTLTPSGQTNFTNGAYEYGPPRTICGIPITLFSHIFLIIGGAAPIVFIISFLIVNRCYKWRRAKRRKTYSASVRQIDEFEKFEQFSKSEHSKNSTSAKSTLSNKHNNNMYLSYNTNSSSKSSFMLLTLNSAKTESPPIIRSDSNPNVYFIKASEGVEFHEKPKHRTHSQRDSGISIMGSKDSLNVESNGNIGESSPNFSIKSDIGGRLNIDSHQIKSSETLVSDEEQVLACFDQIYQEYDSSDSSSNELLNGNMYPAQNLESTGQVTGTNGCHENNVDSPQKIIAYDNGGFVSENETLPHPDPVSSDPAQTCYVILEDQDIINGNLLQADQFRNAAYISD